MSETIEELVAVARVMDRAASLLGQEEARLQEFYGQVSPHHGHEAGGPAQTLRGIGDLHSAARESVERLARAIGYLAAGLDRPAERAVRLARAEPISLPSGADRMARPLGERTVQALEMVRDLDFYPARLATEIEVCLAAPQATYPPDDWNAYQRSRMYRWEN